MADSQPGTIPPSTIKSRPQYSGLHAIPAAETNLIAAEGEGIQAVLRMMGEAPDGFASRSRLVYAETGDPATHDLDCLRAFGLDDIDVVPEPDEAIRYLERLLDAATMGTRLYTVGTEGFIGRVVQHAINHGIDHTSILTEHSGSLARRVQCVHCKQVTENVTVSVYTCPGCGLSLFVRDHYSRRLAAFQAVCVNAEDPDEEPAVEEAYR